MKGTFPLFLVEPSGQEARRRLSEALLRLGTQPSLPDLKSQLREMRERCLRDLESLVAGFKSEVLRYPGTECLSAGDSAEAVELIRRIAQDSRNIVLNRSAAVVNELKPYLQRLGLQVIESYYSELGNFENKIGDYWNLPSLLTRGLTPSFELQNVKGGGGLPRRDCVAVLGVSAACAEDGSVFFVQHSANISQTLEQAREVVLVVGLDKLVKTRKDAALQAICTGIYGLEAMLLNLRQRKGGSPSLDSLPPAVKTADQRWHVILLDNGRGRLLSGSFRELLLCIGCKRCAVQCPINHSMSRDGAVWSPRDHLFMFLLGHNPLMDTCLHCEACRVECPLSIDLPRLMWLARADQAARHGRSLGERLLGNPEALARLGTLTAPVSNALTGLTPARALISASLGLDPERSLPTFHRETFVRWLTKNKADTEAEVTLTQRKVAYFSGCFANYYQPELAKATVNVLKRNGMEVAASPNECCGMPMIANKNLVGFRKNAERNLRSLAALVSTGHDVVTACPSCALMLKHGYPSLCEQTEASLVTQHVYYIDEYLVRLAREGKLTKDMAEVNETVLFHIPCHLKAQDEGRSTLELLRMVPGLSISAANATCCGMGGYHGYRKAYSRLSLDIGRKLFEDIRNTGADKVVTACAACAMQIRHGTGITAIHPVQLLEEACGLDRQRSAGRKRK